MLGPLKMPIQSEAVIKVFESNFDLKTSQMASDWIGMFKGPNMCAQKFSHIQLRLFTLHSFLSKKTFWVPG